jgi:hypothetical protein
MRYDQGRMPDRMAAVTGDPQASTSPQVRNPRQPASAGALENTAGGNRMHSRYGALTPWDLLVIRRRPMQG